VFRVYHRLSEPENTFFGAVFTVRCSVHCAVIFGRENGVFTRGEEFLDQLSNLGPKRRWENNIKMDL
jgi:hypothetical protein